MMDLEMESWKGAGEMGGMERGEHEGGVEWGYKMDSLTRNN